MIDSAITRVNPVGFQRAERCEGRLYPDMTFTVWERSDGLFDCRIKSILTGNVLDRKDGLHETRVWAWIWSHGSF